MNRSTYWNLCEEKLNTLCYRVESRGKLNILDFHLHSEDFYLQFLNLLFGWSLKNLNQFAQNVEGIDLLDSVAKIVLQVSATTTKAKVESALCKNLSKYSGHNFKFVSISKDAEPLRAVVSYKNPHNLTFTPSTDIYDVQVLLGHILHLEIGKQREVYDFLRKELDPERDRRLSETNLAAVINILSKENLSASHDGSTPLPFSVDEKISRNGLAACAVIIEDYAIHHSRVGQVYAEFDRAGANRSRSVLDSLRSSYLSMSTTYSGDELFFQVVERAIQAVQQSANFVPMPLEELALCVNVLAVDAFVRCKIFKNPQAVRDASS